MPPAVAGDLVGQAVPNNGAFKKIQTLQQQDSDSQMELPSIFPVWMATGFEFMADLGMIFGGAVAFYPQYSRISKRQDTDGFNLNVCLILLLAHVLRIFFWLGSPFAMPLLWQSIVMVIMVFALLHLCVTVNKQRNMYTPVPGSRRSSLINVVGATAVADHMLSSQTDDDEGGPGSATVGTGLHLPTPNGSHQPHNSRTQPHFAHDTGPVRSIFDGRWRDFWNWTEFEDYVIFFLLFSAGVGLLCLVLADVQGFFDVLGAVGLLLESTIGVPQFMSNWRAGHAKGVSLRMIAGWLTGDLFRLYYLTLKNPPVQFYICSAIQILVDSSIMVQVVRDRYGGRLCGTKKRKKRALSRSVSFSMASGTRRSSTTNGGAQTHEYENLPMHDLSLRSSVN
eukprot:Clim_evm3s183 gene=Clim_evmTU3s183